MAWVVMRSRRDMPLEGVALLTRMSTRPKSRAVASSIACTLAWSETSVCW
jgi:hypothetical protein